MIMESKIIVRRQLPLIIEVEGALESMMKPESCQLHTNSPNMSIRDKTEMMNSRRLHMMIIRMTQLLLPYIIDVPLTLQIIPHQRNKTVGLRFIKWSDRVGCSVMESTILRAAKMKSWNSSWIKGNLDRGSALPKVQAIINSLCRDHLMAHCKATVIQLIRTQGIKVHRGAVTLSELVTLYQVV